VDRIVQNESLRSSRRRQAAMSADTETPHGGDRISPGSTTIARLRHRRGSSLRRETFYHP
jgi:hypothetical protein